MPKANKRGRYRVTTEYAPADLDGRGPVVWCAGAVVELDTTTAAWVNKNHEGVLVDYVEEADGE